MNLQQAMSASLGAANSSMQESEAAAARAGSAVATRPRAKTPLIMQTQQAQSVSMDMLLQQSLQQLDALLRVTDVMAQQPQENSNGTP